MTLKILDHKFGIEKNSNFKKWCFCFKPGGGTQMKVTGMCLPGNENRGHSIGFCRKKGVIGCAIKKKIGLFWCELPKIGGYSM